MAITFSSITISFSSAVVIFVIVSVVQPKLLPNLIEAIKGWTNHLGGMK